jgi:hypothetical protein
MCCFVGLVWFFNPQSFFGHSASQNHGKGTAEDPFVVPKTWSEIVVDAVLDEEAWQNALVLELSYEVMPGENIPPPVKTEVLLIYDIGSEYKSFFTQLLFSYKINPRTVLFLGYSGSYSGDQDIQLT